MPPDAVFATKDSAIWTIAVARSSAGVGAANLVGDNRDVPIPLTRIQNGRSKIFAPSRNYPRRA